MFELILEKVKNGYDIYDACDFLGITYSTYRKLPKLKREELIEARKMFNKEKNKTHAQGDTERFIKNAF